MTATKKQLGRPPAPYGKTRAMKVPVALFDRVHKLINEWKEGFKK